MKITVGQFNVKSKDIKHNYEKMKSLILKAKEEGYEMIVFGEYALSGYACAELFNQDSFYEELDVYTQKLRGFSKDLIVVFGSVRKDLEHYVTTVILNSDIHYSDKENLTKREFDESKYFVSGTNKSYSFFNQLFLFTFRDDHQESEYKVIVDSSPTQYTKEIEDKIVYANTLGNSQVCKVVFINGGMSYISIGKTRSFKHGLDTGIITSNDKQNDVTMLEALVSGIKNFSNDNFGEDKKWLVGNSGGLDSAVTLSLLTIALGPDRVLSYNLRSKFNSNKTVNNAQHLADNLNIKHQSYSIDDSVDGYLKTLEGFKYTDIPTLAYENIQARTRGHLLGGFSSLEDAVISNNGNKLEIMLGYATLYGDTIGALSSIGDLVKVEVFELARQINEHFGKEVVPLNLIPVRDAYHYTFETPPSAELKSDQVDPMKWYYHDLLVDLVLSKSKEDILELYLHNQFADYEIGKWLSFYNLNQGKHFLEDFNWFMRTFEINNFKRLQMPPVLAYSNRVIGVDYIETALLRTKSLRQEELEALILEKY